MRKKRLRAVDVIEVRNSVCISSLGSAIRKVILFMLVELLRFQIFFMFYHSIVPLLEAEAVTF